MLCYQASASLIGFCSTFTVLITVFRVQIQKGVPSQVFAKVGSHSNALLCREKKRDLQFFTLVIQEA